MINSITLRALKWWINPTWPHSSKTRAKKMRAIWILTPSLPNRLAENNSTWRKTCSRSSQCLRVNRRKRHKTKLRAGWTRTRMRVKLNCLLTKKAWASQWAGSNMTTYTTAAAAPCPSSYRRSKKTTKSACSNKPIIASSAIKIRSLVWTKNKLQYRSRDGSEYPNTHSAPWMRLRAQTTWCSIQWKITTCLELRDHRTIARSREMQVRCSRITGRWCWWMHASSSSRTTTTIRLYLVVIKLLIWAAWPNRQCRKTFNRETWVWNRRTRRNCIHKTSRPINQATRRHPKNRRELFQLRLVKWFRIPKLFNQPPASQPSKWATQSVAMPTSRNWPTKSKVRSESRPTIPQEVDRLSWISYRVPSPWTEL